MCDDCEKDVAEGKVIKFDDLNYQNVSEKTFNFWHIANLARTNMRTGDRIEAMRLYKSLGKEMRYLGEHLGKLVF